MCRAPHTLFPPQKFAFLTVVIDLWTINMSNPCIKGPRVSRYARVGPMCHTVSGAHSPVSISCLPRLVVIGKGIWRWYLIGHSWLRLLWVTMSTGLLWGSSSPTSHHFPYRCLLMLSSNAWPYWASDLIVQAKEPVAEGRCISWGQCTSAEPSDLCCSSLTGDVWTAERNE